MITYNKDLDIKNRTKFNVSMIFNPIECNELNFNCVICERKVSLNNSVSKRGEHLVCCECQYNKFKNYDDLIKFLEVEWLIMQGKIYLSDFLETLCPKSVVVNVRVLDSACNYDYIVTAPAFRLVNQENLSGDLIVLAIQYNKKSENYVVNVISETLIKKVSILY